MEKISKTEYVERLRAYVVEQMMLLNEEDRPKGLRASVDFNREKGAEFDALLETQGIVVE